MTLYQTLKYTVREICYGSGVINVISISIATIILYVLISYFANSQLLDLILGIRNDLNPDNDSFKSFLENITYNNLHTLVIPIITVVIFIESPIKETANNQLLRILPIPTYIRLLAITCSIIYIALTSLLIITIIDYGIIHYVRSIYLEQLTVLQENAGELYTQLDANRIFSTNFKYFNITSLFEKLLLLFFSIVAGLARLNIIQLSKNYAAYKLVLIMVLIQVVISKISQNFIDPTKSLINNTNIDSPLSIYIFTLATILLIFSSYYLIKEREE